MKKHIVKNTGIVSLGINFSRVLGLVRDMVIAGFFGTGYQAAAFVVSFTLPNMLRDFIGEGASNAAIIPVLTEKKAGSTPEEFWKTVNNIVNFFFLVLLAAAAIGIIAAPVLVRMIAPGFLKEHYAITETIRLTRIVFPYIVFMGLTAYASGILNIFRHFAVPAFCQSILNIALIVSALLLCPVIGVYGLAVGVLVGGFLELLVLVPLLRKKGFSPSPSLDMKDPAIKKAGLLLAPRVVGSAVYQVNILADRILGSLYWIVGTGGIPALYYSYRLIQYPIGIFSNALATVILPILSDSYVKGDKEGVKNTITFSLRGVFYIMLPSAVGLAILGKPIIRILFQRGAFDEYSVNITYTALLCYSIGLFAYGATKILAMCFYAMKDTITPVKTAAGALAVNIILNLILMWPLKIGGLALGTSLSAIFNFVCLFNILGRKLEGLDHRSIIRGWVKIFIATIPMGVTAYFLSAAVLRTGAGVNPLISVAGLLAVMAASTVIYFLSTLVFRIEEGYQLIKWISKKN